MEVIHTVEDGQNGPFQFLQDNDKYTVAWTSEIPDRWHPWNEMIKWSLRPTVSPTFRKMDQFILSYFPESLVILAALEMS